MKKILSVLMIMLLGFCFTVNVHAEDLSLSSIASVNSVIGGSDKEIVVTDDSHTYTFYYKYVSIDNDEFNTYLSAKYTLDTTSDQSSEDYIAAEAQVSEYESVFKNKISETSASDVATWQVATDGEITLSELNFSSGVHSGYVLAIAALSDSDDDSNNVYIDKLILEATSSSTLGDISYNSSDDSNYGDNNSSSISDSVTNSVNNTTNSDGSSTVNTDSNPNTGISDYAIYIVPLCIIVGSVLLFRRSYS